MIEERLMDFGILGIWTVVLLVEKVVDKFCFFRRMKEMLRENREYIIDLMNARNPKPTE